MKKHFLLSLFFAFAFFLAAFYTLDDYNVSWDETIHFRRGQAYIHYFLTGETDYSSLTADRRSFYQNDTHNAEHFLNQDVGHPPISDELAALSNYIFFQKLGVLDDISAHHIFNILASSLLVFVVAFFVSSTFGRLAATVSFLALVTYPLFWAESHFNIKDPPEAAFFAATIWLFYESWKRRSALWLLFSFLAFTLALGTKFNALFIPLILIAYLLKSLRSIPKQYLLTLLLGPLLVFVIFVATWPFLTQNFPQNLFKIFAFYQEIGTGLRYQPDEFFVLGFNTYPIRWIIFTTPPLVLVLTFFGIISAFTVQNKYKNVIWLWLAWLLIPILRVTIPGTVIYGGSRQILEFLPAMAMLSGLGGKWLFDKLSAKLMPVTLAALVIVLPFAFLVFNLYKMHPHQNVYFNQLVGGLQGAKERNFPSWGNSFGNAYLSAIKWINENAEQGAKLALIQGTPSNAPPPLLRTDIDYLVGGNVDSQATHFSGIERGGEYLMELTFDDTGKDFHYVWEYVDKFLTPMHEVKVDGVSIAKVWKNDLEHTKPDYRLKETPYASFNLARENNILLISLDEQVLLSRVGLEFMPLQGCFPLTTSFVETSVDGKNWVREDDWIPHLQLGRKSNLEGNVVTFYLAAKPAKYIRFILDNSQSCALNKPAVSITILR